MKLLIPALLIIFFAFFISVASLEFFLRLAKKTKKFMVPDMNKYKKPLVPKIGGIAVIFSFLLAVLLYVAFKTFLVGTTNLLEIFVLLITLMLASFIGFIDDVFGWKNSLTGWQKILMTIPIAIPLMVINAGHHTIHLPFFGSVNLGLFYPLLLIPLGMIGATNGFNLLAGFNGLEGGLAIIIIATLGLIAFSQGQYYLVLISLILLASLFAFFLYNKFPAKVFPGNSFTYLIGAFIACLAILGNMERPAAILFIPFIIEGFLKLRSKFKAHNFGIPNEKDELELPYKKTYSLTHLSMKILKKIKGKIKEKDVTFILFIFELILAIIVLFQYINL